MNSVEKVLAVLEERKIPVSRLERDLKFGNGYVRQLKKGSFPDNRLAMIANYLNVPLDSLLSDDDVLEGHFVVQLGERNKKTATPQGDGDFRFALYGDAAEDVTDEDIRAIREYAEFIRNRRKQP